MSRQQQQTGGSSSRGGTESSEGERQQGQTGAGGTGRAGAEGQRADARSEQERPRQVSREEGAPRGAGLEQTRARQQGPSAGPRGPGQARASLLPAMMANPDIMASAFMSNPFAFAQAMSQEMDRIFSSFDGGLALPSGLQRSERPGGQALQRGQGWSGQGLGQWVPPIEIRQRNDELVVRADLPGLSPDDVHIELEDGVLTLSGEREDRSEDSEEGFYRTERSYGAFARSIALPEGVDEEKVRARFDKGVLEVTVPLREQQQRRGRRIQIEGGQAQPGEKRA